MTAPVEVSEEHRRLAHEVGRAAVGEINCIADKHDPDCDLVAQAIAAAELREREACAGAVVTGACAVLCDHASCGGMRAARAAIRARSGKP